MREKGRTHRGVFGGGDMRRKKTETNKGGEEGGKQIHRGYCFGLLKICGCCGERKRERERVALWILS